MPLPFLLVDCNRDVWAANQALAEIFGYGSVEQIEVSLKHREFLKTHFSSDVVAQLYEHLYSHGHLEGWLLHGQTLSGEKISLEISARAVLRTAQGPVDNLAAVFVKPGNVRDAGAFLQKARKEAELATKAKNEFLANISHELRTPLNIIIGMLDLAMEDESACEDLRLNLSAAKDAANGLFYILNDLIMLSNLEGRRLVSDVAQFSPQLLVRALVRQFSAKAEAKQIRLEAENDQHGEAIFEGGYNLLVMALEKLVDNAIKFSDSHRLVIIRATVEEREDGPWLYGAVIDEGPGLDDSFIKCGQQILFHQGDGSMNRQHGGLGLGLHLADSLVATLGGRLTLANRPEKGADIGFHIPVKRIVQNYYD